MAVVRMEDRKRKTEVMRKKVAMKDKIVKIGDD